MTSSISQFWWGDMTTGEAELIVQMFPDLAIFFSKTEDGRLHLDYDSICSIRTWDKEDDVKQAMYHVRRTLAMALV